MAQYRMLGWVSIFALWDTYSGYYRSFLLNPKCNDIVPLCLKIREAMDGNGTGDIWGTTVRNMNGKKKKEEKNDTVPLCLKIREAMYGNGTGDIWGTTVRNKRVFFLDEVASLKLNLHGAFFRK